MLEWKCYGNDWFSWLSDWNVARSFEIVQANVHWWQQNIQCWYSLLDWIGWKGFTQNWKTIPLRFDACGNPVIVILLKWDVMNEVGQIGQDFLQEVLWTFKVFADCIDALQVIYANMSRSRNKANFPYFGRHVFFVMRKRRCGKGRGLGREYFLFPHSLLSPGKSNATASWMKFASTEG